MNARDLHLLILVRKCFFTLVIAHDYFQRLTVIIIDLLQEYMITKGFINYSFKHRLYIFLSVSSEFK